LMNIWCLHLRTLQAKMGGTHSSFHNDDFPSLDYDVLQIRDPWNAVSLWQNSQFTFECHFLLLSGLNWLIRKWSRIWSLESPGQRASNISLSQKADSNNLKPSTKNPFTLHHSNPCHNQYPLSHSVKRTCCHVAVGQTGLFKILTITWV
jgi:hypothetical protein